MADYNREVKKRYTIVYDDNDMWLISILVEEVDGFGRWLYKRNPQGMELQLTDAIFEETVNVALDNGIFEANQIYEKLRKHDKYYASLMRKVYKKYLQEYVFVSSLHYDAFWGD